MAEVPQTTRGLGPENLTRGTLLPSFLVSGRSLKGPAHAWNASRLSHPGWQYPSKLRHDHRPQEHKGWVSTVLEEREPPRILGTPFLSPAHGPAPPQEGKGGCQSLGSQALGPGLEDERTDGCHCHFRWVLGQGASLHWGGSPEGPAQLCLQPPSPIPSSPSQGTAPQGGGGHLGDGWETVSLTLGSLPHTHTLAQGPGTLWHLHSLAFLGQMLSWATAIPFHLASVVSSAHPCQARPWTPMR